MKDRITPEDIDNLYANSTLTVTKMTPSTLVGCLTLPTGFDLVEQASCVDPENFDEEIGRSVLEKKLKDSLWQLEGYVLKSMRHHEALNTPEQAIS